MAKFKINRTYLGFIINGIASLLLYITYIDIYNSITAKELTAFGSPIQIEGSVAYVCFVFSLVTLIMQIIIFLLKKLAIVLGLTE
ncbi:hypothetical protein ACNF40_05505 [Cuniculiplasma sp. SKW4]|uniref:hypothetical protein n=1 Tax=Cuniculiplasma sp. SKW4 TaxID=3400171 RepID=UPI003FD02A93